MKLFEKSKDGGPESKVTGYFLIESKLLFSIVLLKFEEGSREAFHSHAFNSVSWVLKGKLVEHLLFYNVNFYYPSIRPIFTWRSTFHQVRSRGTTWVLSFRGPWTRTWKEYLPAENQYVTLTHGRTKI